MFMNAAGTAHHAGVTTTVQLHFELTVRYLVFPPEW
jgi:hypothetical protein